MTYWGPHFPSAAGLAYWDGHFPDANQDPTYFSGFGPPGSATFAFDIESGFQVTYTWVTDIIKRYSGSEQRIAVNDAPKQFYKGTAILLDNNPRKVLSTLARYAAIGATYLLGLPHEQMTLVADSSGTSIYVNSTHLLLCDWCHVGQRVVVVDLAGNSINAVCQGTGPSGQILLDTATGSTGKALGYVMPAMAVYLDPQQGFSRHPMNADEWQITARAAIFDFASDPASLALGPITASVGLDNAIVTSRIPGLQGNLITVGIAEDTTFPATGQLVEADGQVQILVKGGVTTFQNLADLLVNSSYVKLTGTWTGSATFAVGTGDEFSSIPLTGGIGSANVGTGATLTTYASRPVWDRYIQVDDTAGDSVQALTEILDMDGVPYSIGSADYADWGRHVMIRRTIRSEWQWFKKFVATVKGRQKTWWLPSYRNDLQHVSHTGTSLVVDATEGDFFAWWPAQRSNLQILQTDGTVTRCAVTNGVDNGDGTATLTLDTSVSATAISSISWLELCRFESDDFTVQFQSAEFSYKGTARVVRL